MLGRFTKAHVGALIAAIAMLAQPMLGYEITADFQGALTLVISTLLVWAGIWGPTNSE